MQTFEQTIIEICQTIEISSDFTISHTAYPSLELSEEMIDKFSQSSTEAQSNLLKLQIQNYLYDIYFDRSLMSLDEIEIESEQPTLIQNNVIDGIDINFRQQLRQGNTGTGYFDPDWLVVANTDNHELIVAKDGLNLHIDPNLHLAKNSSPEIGDSVAIRLPNNLAGQDTYIIVGNLGSPDRVSSVELYFNFTPAGAIAIATSLTHELNKLEIPFQFAILHNPDLFYRTDSGILLLSQSDYLATQNLIAQIYQAHQADFSPNIPLCTKQLAPGLALAEISTTSANFGLQRCELIATGLLAVISQQQLSATQKLDVIRQQFAVAGLDWFCPHLNFATVDCYKPLI